MFRFWTKSKQNKQKKSKKNICIELEIVLLGQVSSRIIRKMKYKAPGESPFLLELTIDCISLLLERQVKQLAKIKVKAKMQ